MDFRPSVILDLSVETLQHIRDYLNSEESLKMIACGNKLLSVKWGYSFVSFVGSPSAWRTLGMQNLVDAQSGKIRHICIFGQLHSLTLNQSSYGGKNARLTDLEIGMLPQQLQNLSFPPKNDASNVLLPPNLTSLSLSKLSANFDGLRAFPTTITRLSLIYEAKRTWMPKCLSRMPNLVDLTFSASTSFSPEHSLQLPQSLTRLSLHSPGGCFVNETSFFAMASTLTCLQSLACYPSPLPNPHMTLDLSALSPTLTWLSCSFANIVGGFRHWHRYPRSLRAIDKEYIAVSYYNIEAFGTRVMSAVDMMHDLPPLFERLMLNDVTVECPLRFVTHLILMSGRGNPRISQDQIDACRNMASVIHLELNESLDHASGLIQLDVCTWQLESLKVYCPQSTHTTQHINLDDYAPWLLPSLTKVEMHCDTFRASSTTLLANVKSLRICVMGDPSHTVGQIPDEWMSLITFVSAK